MHHSILRLAPVILLAVAPSFSAQAGLFDFLSPAAPEPQRGIIFERPAPDELPPLQTAPQHRAEPRRHVIVVRQNANKVAALSPQQAGLKKDHTLQDGDAVMTASGIRVYASTASDSHEFVPLSETKGLLPEERNALAAIDAHRSSEDGWQTKSGDEQLMTGRSTVANSAQAWKWLRDPKGRLVRYVGP